MIHERTVAEEVATVKVNRPHVLVLGAGASRAAFPNGDRHGRKLPVMNDFAACVGLAGLLTSWGFDPSQNFEDTYSALHAQGKMAKLEHLNALIETYFEAMELPDAPTLYDHIVLSLRANDVIATFNWDPLLVLALQRCAEKMPNLSRPKLAFLHGNVLIGYCEKHSVTGLAGMPCSKCHEPFRQTPLLFPIGQKDYATDRGIAAQWAFFKQSLGDAFMLTIFGYSGPKTDEEAITAMRSAWGTSEERSLEQTAFITLQTDDEVNTAWDKFIHTHHYEVQNDFYDSWIAKHPRRTGEAYIAQYLEAIFIEENPLPCGLDWPKLCEWYRQFEGPELAAPNLA